MHDLMHKQVSYYDLGATLYTPCTHSKLAFLLCQPSALPTHTTTAAINPILPKRIRSTVFCLEDAVSEAELPAALNNLEQSLSYYHTPSSVKRFIRPRNPEVLSEILTYKNIDRIDGFVLPKFDLNTAKAYRRILAKQAPHHFFFMPTLESAQVFDATAMRQLATELKSWGQCIICLRIGGNDLMNLIGIKRMPGFTIYDTPLRTTIDQLILSFRTEGFELSAPVFDILNDPETLKREIAIDIAYGFYAKTAIHPHQVDIIENAYQDFADQHATQVQGVLNPKTQAVFSLNGQMMEVACHKSWATRANHLAKQRQKPFHMQPAIT